MKKILLIIALLILARLAISMETFICEGSESTYQCHPYSGGDYDVYNYGAEYVSGLISLHEYDSYDLANPYPDMDEHKDVVFSVAYSPWIEAHQVPEVFLDPKWQSSDPFGVNPPWSAQTQFESDQESERERELYGELSQNDSIE